MMITARIKRFLVFLILSRVLSGIPVYAGNPQDLIGDIDIDNMTEEELQELLDKWIAEMEANSYTDLFDYSWSSWLYEISGNGILIKDPYMVTETEFTASYNGVVYPVYQALHDLHTDMYEWGTEYWAKGGQYFFIENDLGYDRLHIAYILNGNVWRYSDAVVVRKYYMEKGFSETKEELIQKIQDRLDQLEKEKEAEKQENQDIPEPAKPARDTEKVAVVFDPNRTGATISERTRVVSVGDPYGDLPVPECPGYVFQGWYLEEELGTYRINAETVMDGEYSVVKLLAHWEQGLGSSEDNPVTVSPDTVISKNDIDQPKDGIIREAESALPGKAGYTIYPSFNAVNVSTSDKKVAKAKINRKAGNVTVKTKKAGTAEIIVTGSGGESQTYRVYVEMPKVNKNALKVSMATVSMNLTDYVTGVKLLSPTQTSSSDTSVATASGNGTLTITGPGKTKISLYFGKKKYKGTLKVKY